MAHSTDIPWIDYDTLNKLIDTFAYELYKTYNGKITLDIFIVGGSAMIIKHPEFRLNTVDIDTFISANESQFKVSKFIKQFANKYNYVPDWMNEDVCKSTSFSLRLLHNAIHYCTLYNCCRVI